MAILVLLQGFNPLPNYVVAKYLAKHDQDLLGEKLDEIIVFYSKQTRHNNSSTQQYAVNLQKLLDTPKVKVSLMPLTNINNGHTIRSEVERALQDLIAKQSIVHLNYTGGTKATGIHSYMTIRTMCESYHARFTASYLDDRQHMLYWDNNLQIQSVNDLSLTITEFLSLHCYEDRRPSGANDEFGENIPNSAALMQHLLSLWRYDRANYCKLQNVISGLYRRNDGYVKAANDLQANFSAMQHNIDDIWPILEPVGLSTLRQLKASVQGHELSKKLSIKDDLKIVQFIRGFWFECYVKQELQNAAPDDMPLTAQTFGRSLTVSRGSEKQFELDLYLIRGYQLIGISVTTDDTETLCKTKGFEVIHRTRQIGGDGRMAFLVTLLPDKKRDHIQEELKSDTDISERFRVFGESDLNDIGSKIVRALNSYE